MIESTECPKQDSDDDEKFMDGELSELFDPTPVQPESIIQTLQPIESKYPLSLPAQDQIIPMPVKPTLVTSDNSNLDSSGSEMDQDLVQPIMHILKSKPLIFKNAQIEGAVKPSQLPDPLDFPSYLSKELPPDSPTISKSIILDLAHQPLIAPIDEFLPPSSLGPQHYGKPCSLAPVQSVVTFVTYFSISTSLLTDPPLRKDSLPTKGL
ncbi:hypothetical protein QJS04_geneDACA017545 [Acorus gramineus]|uniref:Uncharacterized protein n=1 Tax=Acorus gramineus TaxID=55184 RepID=A0AAV9BS74_ACOGR|nr:hypothetical protein QJS04_geneDACA017545 [Acorus gramineus]